MKKILEKLIFLKTLFLYGFYSLLSFLKIKWGKQKFFDLISKNFSVQFGMDEISAQGLIERFNSNKPTLLFDIRTKAEQSVSVIPGAILVTPEEDLSQRKEFKDFIQKYKGNDKALITGYCAGGYRAARSLSKLPKIEGIETLNIHGAIVGYANAGGRLINSKTQEQTHQLHGCTKSWGSFVLPPNQMTLEPKLSK